MNSIARMDDQNTPSALALPGIATAGEPVLCRLAFVNEGQLAAPRPTVNIIARPFGTLDARSVHIDGERVAATGTGNRLSVSLAPMQPGQRVTVSFLLTLPIGIPNGQTCSIDAVLTAGGTRVSLGGSVRARSSPFLDPARSLVGLEQPFPLRVGQPRTLQVAVYNAGTSAAEDVQLRCAASDDVRVGAMPMLGDVPVSETRMAYLTITPTGAHPRLELEATYGGDSMGCAALPPFAAPAHVGARLSGEILRDGALPFPTAAKHLPIRLTVRNSGDVAAESPVVFLALPEGVTIFGSASADVTFPTLPPGAQEERTVLLDVASVASAFTLEGAVSAAGEDAVEIISLDVHPLGVRSVSVHEFAVHGSPVAGEDVATSLLLSFDGNEKVDETIVDVAFGDAVRFGGDLQVNGAPVNATLDEPLALHDVEPGTLIAVTWLTHALRGTIRGATTALTASVRAADRVLDVSTKPFSITPRVQSVSTLADLPFRVRGTEALALSGALALTGSKADSSAIEPVPATPADAQPEKPVAQPPVLEEPVVEQPVAVVDKGAGDEHGAEPPEAALVEPVVQSNAPVTPPETLEGAGDAAQAATVASTMPVDTEGAHDDDDEPAIAPPVPGALRVLRSRLSLAASSRTPLQVIIYSLGALADAGTHPATSEYQKATFALRRALTESSVALTPAVTNKLRDDLSPFATLVPGTAVPLLQGLGAIADVIANSTNAEAPYWPTVKDYGRKVSEMLRAAQGAKPDLETDPTAEHPAFADVRHVHAQLTLAVPAA